jgi:hypothetical protein
MRLACRVLAGVPRPGALWEDLSMAYFDIDVYSRKIATGSPDAQLWFDRGLVWTYA